jgi:hypothetical protein
VVTRRRFLIGSAALAAGLAVDARRPVGGETRKNEVVSKPEMWVWAGTLSLVGGTGQEGFNPPLSQARLVEWKNDRHLTGWMVSPGNYVMRTMGGDGGYSPDPEEWSSFEWMRQWRDTKFRERCAALGIENYVQVKCRNAHPVTGRKTPFVPWHLTTEWTDPDPDVGYLADLRKFCASAFAVGMTGVTFDGEMFSDYGDNINAAWGYDYPSKPRAQTREQTAALIKSRGKQIGDAIVRGMPVSGGGPSVIWYPNLMEGSWYELLRGTINGGNFDEFSGSAHPWLIAGLLTSGIKDLTIIDAIFFKGTQLTAHDDVGWHNALSFNTNGCIATLSRALSNRERRSALGKIGISGFFWPTASNSTTEAQAVSPGDFEVMLRNGVRFGGNRRFGIYTQYVGNDEATEFDGRPNQEPYEPAYQQYVRRSVVDSMAPTLTVQSPTTGASHRTRSARVGFSGFAEDDYAIRRILWSNKTTGVRGAATMTHTITDPQWDPLTPVKKPRNSELGALGLVAWQMDWQFEVALAPGTNVITIQAEDAHGLVSAVKTVTVRRA